LNLASCNFTEPGWDFPEAAILNQRDGSASIHRRSVRMVIILEYWKV